MKTATINRKFHVIYTKNVETELQLAAFTTVLWRTANILCYDYRGGMNSHIRIIKSVCGGFLIATMALVSTQPLTEMSTRNISWGVKTAGA